MKLLTGFIRDAKIIILNGKPVVNSFPRGNSSYIHFVPESYPKIKQPVSEPDQVQGPLREKSSFESV